MVWHIVISTEAETCKYVIFSIFCCQEDYRDIYLPSHSEAVSASLKPDIWTHHYIKKDKVKTIDRLFCSLFS